jgi:predicted RNA-binding protein (virulence factor B family)
LAATIQEDHLFVVITARKGTISYKNALERLPDELQKYFSGKNLMIIFPDQYGDQKDDHMSFTEAQHHEETSLYTTISQWIHKKREVKSKTIMLKLGDYHILRIKKRTDYGLYLDGGDEGNILLPNRYVTKDMRIGDEIEVFIYLDQDERTIATTEHPIAKVGEFAWMECAWTNEYGAFLHWGLMKDLFCPFREQKQRMERGKKYYVYVKEDEKTHRLMATAKVERYQQKTGHELALDFSEELLRYLYEHDGHCDLGDKSPAEEIAARFGVSKKVFKQAVGDLYKRQIITISDDGLHLVH